MRTVDLNPLDDPTWTAAIEALQGHLFVSPPWLRAMASTYGLRFRGTLLLDDFGRPRAAICSCPVDDLLGSRLVTLPFSDFADPVGARAEDVRVLVDDLTRQGVPVQLRARRSSLPDVDASSFTRSASAKWHGIDLSGDLESLNAGFHSSARRAIRRATGSGVEVEARKDREGLRAFFDLHLRIRKQKYRLLAQPFALFESLWDSFISRDEGVLMLARHGGDVIAGTLYLQWGSSVYYKYNASDPASLGLRPNDLLVAAGVEYAHAHGATTFDFGLSDAVQEGLLRFKRKFATEEEDIVSLRHVPGGWDGRRDEQVRALLHELTWLLTDEDVPDHVTEAAGGLLYRHFL